MKETESQEARFIEYLEGVKKLIAKIARVYCKNDEDRKDLIQDIILQLWKSFPKYNDNYAVSTWTYRIAINVSISFLRKLTTRKNTHNSYQQAYGLMNVNDTVLDDNLKKLYRFINLLKPIDKAIIVLFLEGCKNKEIASIMGMSATNISTRKQRIKEKLKSYFESDKQQ